MNEAVFETRFSSELCQIKKVIRDAFGFINEHLSLSPEDSADLRLLLSDLQANAVIHGNHNDSCKNVGLIIRINGNTIYSTVLDEGQGFDYTRQLETELRLHQDGPLRESGRGILLVSYLADSVAYDVAGNRIDFYKKVAPL
jgi:serine/threonine-protein kinase RsbW